MPFQKGQTGNPNGRPKKDRALTAILETAGAATVEDGDRRVAGRRLMAEHMWNLATRGTVTLPDGRTFAPDFEEWAGVVRWLYSHIDGPPKQQVELSGDAEAPLKVAITNVVAEIPTRVASPDEDTEA